MVEIYDFAFLYSHSEMRGINRALEFYLVPDFLRLADTKDAAVTQHLEHVETSRRLCFVFMLRCHT